jgi:hypothetical protein
MEGANMNRSKKVVRLGMDVGKNTFHLVGVDEAGLPAVKRNFAAARRAMIDLIDWRGWIIYS